MTDISKEAVERHIERIGPAPGPREGYHASLNYDTITMLRALSARVEELEATRIRMLNQRLSGQWRDEIFEEGRLQGLDAGWRDMDDPELPMDGTQFLSMQDDWGPFVTWRDDTRNYPWRFLDRDNQINGFRDGEHGPTRWTPLLPAPGTQPATEQQSVKEAARVLIAEREDHGEGLEGELAPYSLDDEGMVPDLDGDWVKLEAVTAALRSLAQGDE